MIGVARRILDALLLKRNTPHLSHEILVTLMSEVMAIMNARPLVPVSSDPDMPAVLSPAMLLTQKVENVSPPPGQFDLKDLYSKQWKNRIVDILMCWCLRKSDDCTVSYEDI